MSTTTSFGSVDELRRAIRTMRSDGSGSQSRRIASPDRWIPAPRERVVLVCRCGGSAGATTVALALATVAGRARVVETCGGGSSGLTYAASAELGPTDHGWFRGSRNEVVVERRADSIASPDNLPTPTHTDLPLTIIDSSWDLAAVLASPGWLSDLTRSASTVVLVTRASVPGLRRLETALDLVGETRAMAATVGAKRWPRPVEQSAGPAVRRLAARDGVVAFPEVPLLAISGLTPDPLPRALLRPAHDLLTLLEGPQP